MPIEAIASKRSPPARAILDADVDRSATPASARRARPLGLRLGQRDAGDVDAVIAAACTAKLPHPQPTSSSARRAAGELGAHELELGLLRLLERRRPREKIAQCRSSTRQEEREELRRQIVVVADRARSRAIECRRPSGTSSTPVAPAVARGPSRAPRPARAGLGGAVERRRLPGLQEGDRRVDVIDVESPET
jgi:hypothetical protein